MAGCGCGKKKSAAGLKVEADQKMAAEARRQQSAESAQAMLKRNPVRQPATAALQDD